MATTYGFKPMLDLPEWRSVANAVGASAAGVCMASDHRNTNDRDPHIYVLRSASALDKYNTRTDEWLTLTTPALAGTFGAGACCVFAPSLGPRGVLGTVTSATKMAISTSLPAAVGVNQLANRGDGIGFKIRIIGNAGAGSSGKTHETVIVANTSGTQPTIILESAPAGWTPAAGDAFEILSGRLYMLCAGTTAAGIWKYYDVATNSMSGNLATTNLPATIGTDTTLVALDECHCPLGATAHTGFLNQITSTAVAGTSITGSVGSTDASVLANAYRNFQIRIVEDTTNKTAVGQRRIISSHTAGPSPVYTVPTWTVTPSVGAKFVIELPNYILGWTSASANTHTYAPIAIGAMTADSWNTTQFVARGGAVGAGCFAEIPFGMPADPDDIDKNFRWSYIYAFRGGAGNVCDVLDIAGAATGLWSNDIAYGHKSANLTFTTGSCACYLSTGLVNTMKQAGRYMLINQSGTQRMYVFDMYSRTMIPYGYFRYTQGTAVVGCKLAAIAFIDGIQVPIVYHLRNTGTEFFQMVPPLANF